MIRMLSLGAGVQSTTLALMVASGDLPPIDGAIFADTQWEPESVYQHLAWLMPLLPFPVHSVTAGDIVQGIRNRRNTTGGRYAAIPWFVLNPDGSKGMGRRQCTSEYKLTPIMRKLRDVLGVNRRGRIKAGTVEQWIGISTDEASRMKPARQQWIVNRWPLIELGMSRADCLSWLERHGYPAPPKSACLGCPFHSQRTWEAVLAALGCPSCGTARYQPNARCNHHPTKEYHMSFSVTFVGKPEAIKRKLVEESARLTGQSKTEFDAVCPALETILDQQVGNGAVHLSANGHATFTDGVKTYGNCNVEVKTLGQIAE